MTLRAHPAVTEVRSPDPASSICDSPTDSGTSGSATSCEAGPGYGDSTMGAGSLGQCRVCLGQSDGAAPCRARRAAPWSATCWRRCSTRPASPSAEYYINDAGAQVDVLARSTHLRYREALGETIAAIPEGYYPGDYLKDVGSALAARDGDALARCAGERLARPGAQLRHRRDDGADPQRSPAVGIVHDVFTSERALVEAGAVDAALEDAGRCGAALYRHARAAEGQAARRLGAAAADAVPRDPVRRRRRPAGAQVGRLVDLFRRRHGLSPRQVSPRLQPT